MNEIQANQSNIYYVNQFAESIRDQIQDAFDWYRSTIGMSEFMFDVFGSMIMTMIVFWVVGGLYSFLDIFHWPAFLYQFKTQDQKVTVQEIIATAKVALKNQLTVQFAASILFQNLMVLRKMDNSPRVPPLSTIVYHLAVFAMIQETLFYYLHRLFHHGIFYRMVHKVHHHWQAPIAIAAIYCHPLEHFMVNLVPVLLGPLVMGSHRAVMAIWLLIVHFITLNDHSGYHFPLMPSPEFHDYHHLKFNQNFGRMGLLDYLHGTNDRYLKSKYSKRHQVLLSLTPMKVLVPTADEKSS